MFKLKAVRHSPKETVCKNKRNQLKERMVKTYKDRKELQDTSVTPVSEGSVRSTVSPQHTKSLKTLRRPPFSALIQPLQQKHTD